MQPGNALHYHNPEIIHHITFWHRSSLQRENYIHDREDEDQQQQKGT